MILTPGAAGQCCLVARAQELRLRMRLPALRRQQMTSTWCGLWSDLLEAESWRIGRNNWGNDESRC